MWAGLSSNIRARNYDTGTQEKVLVEEAARVRAKEREEQKPFHILIFTADNNEVVRPTIVIKAVSKDDAIEKAGGIIQEIAEMKGIDTPTLAIMCISLDEQDTVYLK